MLSQRGGNVNGNKMRIEKGSKWDFETSPFCKITATAYRHGGSRTTFIRVIGFSSFDEIAENNFIIGKTVTGEICLKKGSDATDRLLYFGSVSDGFRGGSGIHSDYNKATILTSASCSSNCEGETVFAAIIEPEKPLVYYSYGRRTDSVVIINYLGESVEMTSQEAKIYFSGETDEEIQIF